jgi:D-sedoheptulose 7-phosphate isomerase
MSQFVQAQFLEMSRVLAAFSTAEMSILLATIADVMASALQNGRKIIACGNGGSMCDAMHFAEELSGRFRADRPALAAMALSDPAHLTCVANDYGFEHVFARGVEAFGQAGDVLLAISTSGNSPNVLRAAEAALSRQMKVVALTGKDGGRLALLPVMELRVPIATTTDRIQEIHIKVIHLLIELIERQLFPTLYS